MWVAVCGTARVPVRVNDTHHAAVRAVGRANTMDDHKCSYSRNANRLVRDSKPAWPGMIMRDNNSLNKNLSV
jgi:hypothetical protein